MCSASTLLGLFAHGAIFVRIGFRACGDNHTPNYCSATITHPIIADGVGGCGCSLVYLLWCALLCTLHCGLLCCSLLCALYCTLLCALCCGLRCGLHCGLCCSLLCASYLCCGLLCASYCGLRWGLCCRLRCRLFDRLLCLWCCSKVQYEAYSKAQSKPQCKPHRKLQYKPAARVGAIAIQRMVHRKASAPPACAQSRASAGGAAFWHSGCKNRGFGPSPAAGEASKRESAPAAARGVQRALVRLRFSVWCIERHRHRRLVRKAAQAQVGPLSGTRLQIGAIWGQAPLLARRAVSITAQPRRAECSARWCDCDSAYGASREDKITSSETRRC